MKIIISESLKLLKAEHDCIHLSREYYLCCLPVNSCRFETHKVSEGGTFIERHKEHQKLRGNWIHGSGWKYISFLLDLEVRVWCKKETEITSLCRENNHRSNLWIKWIFSDSFLTLFTVCQIMNILLLIAFSLIKVAKVDDNRQNFGKRLCGNKGYVTYKG